MPAPLKLRRLLAPMILPLRTRIRSGPNVGRRWSRASGRYLAGTMEKARMALIERLVRPGEAFWDVGAHHGYVALHASRCVGPEGIVYAFEPSPYNLSYLRKHLEWNDAENIALHPVALGGTSGTAHLDEAGSSRGFALGSQGAEVAIESIPRLVEEHGLRPPDILKLDVEGSEGDVVEAAAAHLSPSSRLLVAIHSMDDYQRVGRALRSVDFTVFDSAGARRLRETEPEAWSDDPDVLAYGPEAGRPGPEVLELLERI